MKRGFTLVEVLIVVSVIIILSTISVLAYDQTQKQAEDSAASATVSAVKSGAEKYYSTNNEYPLAADIHGAAVTGAVPTNYVAASQILGVPRANLDGAKFKLIACTSAVSSCKTDVLAKNRVYYFTKATQTSTAAEVITSAAGTGCSYTFAATDTGALGFLLAYYNATDNAWKFVRSDKGTVTTSDGTSCPFTAL